MEKPLFGGVMYHIFPIKCGICGHYIGCQKIHELQDINDPMEYSIIPCDMCLNFVKTGDCYKWHDENLCVKFRICADCEDLDNDDVYDDDL